MSVAGCAHIKIGRFWHTLAPHPSAQFRAPNQPYLRWLAGAVSVADRDPLALACQMVAGSGVFMDFGSKALEVQRVVFDAAMAALNGRLEVATMVSNCRWRRSLRCSVYRTGVDCGAFLVPVDPTSGPKWSHRADTETSGGNLPRLSWQVKGDVRGSCLRFRWGCTQLLSSWSQVRSLPGAQPESAVQAGCVSLPDDHQRPWIVFRVSHSCHNHRSRHTRPAAAHRRHGVVAVRQFRKKPADRRPRRHVRESLSEGLWPR
jgi:hypothetical protein